MASWCGNKDKDGKLYCSAEETTTTTVTKKFGSAACEMPKGAMRYVGERYITKFADPIQWDSTRAYEQIEAVQHEGFTYISKQPVPVGVEIDNEEFWLLWADPNAQMEQLRQLVLTFDGRITDATNVTEKSIFYFDTVAEMKASQLLHVGAMCITKGFYAVNDGGGATYEITGEEQTINEMDVIRCGELYAHLQVSSYIKPEQLGAKGDGVSNDSPALNRAVYLSHEHNATVLLGAKTYSIESPIMVDAPFSLEGVSSIDSMIKCIDCDGIAMRGTPDVFISGLHIKHVKLIQSTLTVLAYPDFTNATHKGLYLQCLNSTVEDVVCKGFSVGFHMYAAVNNIQIYHDHNKDGENQLLNLCNALYCNTGFLLETYDSFASNLTAGFCINGIHDKTFKLDSCHVWGWFNRGYIFDNVANYAIMCTNLELEACLAARSANTYNNTPVWVNASVIINGFSHWNIGTNKSQFLMVRDNARLIVTGLFVGEYGTINPDLESSKVLATIAEFNSPRLNCIAYVQGLISQVYDSGRVFLQNSTTSYAISNVATPNRDANISFAIKPGENTLVGVTDVREY